MTISNNPGPQIPQSNPLGDNATGTTISTTGKVTTGGQNANVKQDATIKGTEGVAQSEKANIGETSTIKAANDIPTSDVYSAVNLDSENPKIPPSREAKPQSKVNPWLTSFFLTALTVNFTAIAMLGKEIHKAESKFTVQMLEKVWKQAVQTADLIMAKAQTEANMHLAMAISAMVGLAVSIAGTALALGGLFKTSAAKSRAKALDLDSPTTPKSGEVQAGPSPLAPKRPSVDAPQSPKNSYLTENTNSPVVGREFPAGKPAGSKSPKALGKEPPAPVPEQERIAQAKTTGKAMTMIGTGIQQSANSVKEIIENIVQMIFKPILAKFDGDIEKSRAVKDLASKALDSSIQAFNQANDMVDGATRAIDKLSETIKAHSINSRG